jgi:formylglycine-generating enzyme required for sulfatase activity
VSTRILLLLLSLVPIALLCEANEAALQAPALPRLPFDAAKARMLQEEWARSFDLDAEISASGGMKLVLIPGGRFDMGPSGSTYRVSLAKPYYLSATEITLGQYRKFKPGHTIVGADDEFNAADRPAAMVSWQDARDYCTWLSERPEEKAARRLFALPTEAQWEWGARAGAATSRYFGETAKDQAEHSWFNVTYTPNPKLETKGRGRQPVGKLKPNAFGLHDMLGNVWEWCADRRIDDVTGESRDPVMRGGSWRSGASHCTAVAHDPGAVNLRADNIVACRIEKAKSLR